MPDAAAPRRHRLAAPSCSTSSWSPPSGRFRPFLGNLSRLLATPAAVKPRRSPTCGLELAEEGRTFKRSPVATSSVIRRRAWRPSGEPSNLTIGFPCCQLAVRPLPCRAFGDKKIAPASVEQSSAAVQRGARRFIDITSRPGTCQPRAIRMRTLSFFPFRTTNTCPSIACSGLNRSFSSVIRRSFT